MKLRLIVPAVVMLALNACATDEEDLRSFVSGRDFVVLGNSDQVYYVTGLADAFTYLSAKTGHQPGLSSCYRKYDVNTPALAIELEGYIKRPLAYDRNYIGPDLVTLPAAEVFDRLSSLYCKNERLDPAFSLESGPHSFVPANEVRIWRFADPAYFVAGLADAFGFFSESTGYRRGLSDCYRKRYADRNELMASFRRYIKSPRTHDQAAAGPLLETLPAAEVFDEFSSLYCTEER